MAEETKPTKERMLTVIKNAKKKAKKMQKKKKKKKNLSHSVQQAE